MVKDTYLPWLAAKRLRPRSRRGQCGRYNNSIQPMRACKSVLFSVGPKLKHPTSILIILAATWVWEAKDDFSMYKVTDVLCQ